MGDAPKLGPAFIHGKLDDYGLSPAQFRVYCHIARRGTCFEAADRIAEVCRMHADTVWTCLKFLCDQGLINSERRQGETTKFWIAPMLQWKENPPEIKGRVTRRKRRGAGCRKQRGDHPPETKGHKVTPFEVTPKEVGGESPHVFDQQAKGKRLSGTEIIATEKRLKEFKQELKDINERHRGQWEWAPIEKRQRREFLKLTISKLQSAIDSTIEQSTGVSITTGTTPIEPQPKRTDRNVGTANDGEHEQYRGFGKVGNNEIQEQIKVKLI